MNEKQAAYLAGDEIIRQALEILKERHATGNVLGDPAQVKAHLRLELGALEHETFGAIWLTNQNAIIRIEEMFRGTIGQASIYPREVVKSALSCNAAACILYHNHPSGLAEPSEADKHLTRSLIDALKLVDVRILDHFVAASGDCVSFAERGLI
ncbi:MAG: JAB domain-containing protein [Pseudomonadota bacterium]|jgi:DNA repair protein RadC